MRSDKITGKQRRDLEAENALWPIALEEIPRARWPTQRSGNLMRCLRSRGFLVQVYRDGEFTRLSINRSALRRDGRWEDKITWDEIQRLKAEAGYGHLWALEVYPPAGEVVNVANVRHIFLASEPPAFAWRSADDAATPQNLSLFTPDKDSNEQET